jgi:hypothetical protein
MKVRTIILVAAIVACLSAIAQSPAEDHLTPDEVKVAAATKPGIGFVEIIDRDMFVASSCTAQAPEEFLYTPDGWLSALSAVAKHQYLPFNPSPDDTLRALTIVSYGCALGSPSGPSCDSITRVALISDVGGSVVVEALTSHSRPITWQNGYGATAACNNLVSKFALADVQKVRNAKGEFLIVTFAGSTLLKTYTVKAKFIKNLGL